MAIGAAIFSAATGAYGAYQGHKEGQRAERAMDAQAQAQADDLAFRRQVYQDSQDRYAKWEEFFWPIMEEIAAEAERDTGPDYEAVGADNRAAFATAREATGRSLQRRGLDPSSGNFAHLEHRSRLAEAGSLVGNRNAAREQAENERFAKLGQAYQMGSGLQVGALRGVQQGAGLVSGGYQNQAGMYGQHTWMHGNAATAGWRAFGSTDWENIWNTLTGDGGGG